MGTLQSSKDSCALPDWVTADCNSEIIQKWSEQQNSPEIAGKFRIKEDALGWFEILSNLLIILLSYY